MVSALCSCQNVLVVNQTDDTERTKMISGNDYDKQTGFVVFLVCLISVSMTRLCFVSFTKMYSLRPSLKMLHEIF